MKNRRNFLKSSLALAGAAAVSVTAGVSGEKTTWGAENAKNTENEEETCVKKADVSRIALNTATIMHYHLPLLEQIRVAHEAGFRNLEIWFNDLDAWLAEGGKLPELRSRLDDLDMKIVGGINFFPWAVPEKEPRRKAVADMRSGMEKMRVLGCSNFAAAPAGIYSRTDISLAELADRYRAILVMGEEFGVFPQLEIWGGAKTLSRLSDAVWVATETVHPRASLLLDVYHLYRGGNDYTSLKQLNGAQMTNFHWNDWPGGIEREALKDGDRVFPGDGVAPFVFIRKTLAEIGYQGTFSLEIFNKTYCETYTPVELLKIAYEKMKRAV
ncbi:MAG: sugar phosphate isomerase/epimerase family protein [Planctomycetia bacterium]|nr:sugar phosphate isomerase/epimerase family protein [Planctomycetia bacterium]